MKHIGCAIAVSLCCCLWSASAIANPVPETINFYCHQEPGTTNVELYIECYWSPYGKYGDIDCGGTFEMLELTRTDARGNTEELNVREMEFERSITLDTNMTPGPYKYVYKLGYWDYYDYTHECIIVVLPAEDTVPANASAKETASPGSAQHAGPVYFVAEKVYVDVTADTMAVKGVYTFENTSDTTQRQAIGYPMPYKGFAAPATDVQVSGALAVKTDKDAAHFIIEVPAKKSTTLTVQYRHKLTGSKARYLLSTAAGWGRPLESAIIEVSVPAALENATLSIPATQTEKKDGAVIRRIHKTKMLWKQDLDITLPAKPAQ